ncbi:arsenate reductase (glutaredoxin) [Solitalea canadensis]|uniref:Glutaredoxin-dependent arsenate reductase n=1 Tax=Solitalea canadensis (strain ATCC 29591 / DSM 3403 / JCM 21819 / LMG 8368 / NBRC 15130 / NCIMB 12057 / USAM 9D) TaxID=929556 RepID=H8KN42_SOLCM|nr:arsenate reductase (glutaredoxin) [Solitalea canadensis]AFD09375.1 glutaredoxin-dependent arsenate reductase [Solitalea canadensis DSM 3403]
MKILHNPKCSTSRTALKLLEEKGAKLEIIKYIDDKLSVDELKDIIKLIGINPIELVRTKEPIWKEQFAGKSLSDDEIVNAMIEFPQLMERPIVIEGNRAVIGRPVEKVIELLK